MCTINDNPMYGSGDMVHDRRTEKVGIELDAPPKNTRTWTFCNKLFNTLNPDTFADNTGLEDCLRRTVWICEIACLRTFLYLS